MDYGWITKNGGFIPPFLCKLINKNVIHRKKRPILNKNSYYFINQFILTSVIILINLSNISFVTKFRKPFYLS